MKYRCATIELGSAPARGNRQQGEKSMSNPSPTSVGVFECARWCSRLIRTPALIALVASASALHAQTIVPNANLDTELPPWSQLLSSAPDPVGVGATPAWVASPDLNNSALSGSAMVHIDAAASATNAISGMAQCFDFITATSVGFLNYGMSFRVPATTTEDGSVSATVEIRLFSSSGCSGFISGGAQGQTLAPANVAPSTWYSLGDNSFVPAGAPVMAASAEVRGYLRRTGANPAQSDYPINLDHFVLVLNSTTPVELTHFVVD
jgi:hypothetical protein